MAEFVAGLARAAGPATFVASDVSRAVSAFRHLEIEAVGYTDQDARGA